jgi:RimJ/RimL family protein N-acetyltransferase
MICNVTSLVSLSFPAASPDSLLPKGNGTLMKTVRVKLFIPDPRTLSLTLPSQELTFILLARNPSSDPATSTADFLSSHDPSRMIGDVNLFLSDSPPSFSDDDESEGAAAVTWAECEVMIAEPGFRRQGCAEEALRLMLSYALQNLPRPPRFFVRIGISNKGSLALFERLGFVRHRVTEAFQEVELRAAAKPVVVDDQCAWGDNVVLNTIEYRDP